MDRVFEKNSLSKIPDLPLFKKINFIQEIQSDQDGIIPQLSSSKKLEMIFFDFKKKKNVNLIRNYYDFQEFCLYFRALENL